MGDLRNGERQEFTRDEEHLERGILSVKERKKGPRCGWTRRKPR